MGNDGGSIPKRRELVKNASRPPTVSELKATALESLGHAWTHCGLSGAPLDLENAVSDWRGRLYNYEAMLEALSSSSETADSSAVSLGITSLRDVAKLKFSRSDNQWTCPISMKELGPATKAVYLVPCGHVFAEVAMTETQASACPVCGQEFDSDNVIPLLAASDRDIERLEKRMDKLRSEGLGHMLKKDRSDRKKKKRKRKEEEVEEIKGQEAKAKCDDKQAEQKPASRLSGINNAMAASLAAKVMAEQDVMRKRRKLVADGGNSSMAKN
ncbi:hypothetical protein CDD82_4331 [Ophiocordyceps australis]|uniref:Uncharacterized protein n=1 Tax=Ophiocordyceps australis TaxID=1399860 RepID=A0A2C5Z8D4_9HYPO|nr:hypothetical protein CDD82_4331 [Ophiocordyceps australis]